MSSDENQDIPMAECGACNAIIPLDSKSCPSCGIRISGVSDKELGECGACGHLQPVDSTSCSNCGVSFVAEEQPEVGSSDEETAVSEDPVAEPLPIHEPVPEEIPEEIETNDVEVQEDETTVDEEIDSIDDSFTDDDDIEMGTDDDSSEDESTQEIIEEEVSEEETEEENSEEPLEESEDSAEDESEDDESVVEEDSEDEVDEEPVEEVDNTAVIMAFENLALAIAGTGMTAVEVFAEIDTSDDNKIDAPELQKGIEKIGGEKLKPKEVTAILNYLDANENNRIDPMELVTALEDLKIGIKPGKMPKEMRTKEFPSNAQKFLMGKKANDILYPVMYFFMVTIIGVFIVNGMGIIVDGSGGNIVYDGNGDNWNHCGTEIGDRLGDECSGFVNNKETYPCDKTIDSGECRNSLTPFSGDGDDGLLNSMPAGFYLDGIIIIVLATIGLGLTAYLHLVYAPKLRDMAKNGGKSEEDDSDEEDNEDSDEEDEDSEEGDSDEEDEEEDDDSDEEDEEEDEDSDDEDSDEEDDYDDEEDAIDVGSWVGLEIDGEEIFGEIIEFDDDEGTVTIETEDGDEVTGDQEDMFLEDDE